jgi:outer membrane immunogenic protein
MKVKGFLLAGAAGIAAVPAAQAADLTVKAPAMAPPPVSSWTGLYIGASAGAAFLSHTDIYAYGSFLDPIMNTATTTGFIGGGQIGYNFQSGSFVYGIEGDFSGLSGKVSTHGIPNSTYTGQVSWLATARGRVGLAIGGDTLAYFTAGVAFTHVKSQITPPSNNPTATYSDSSTRTGLVLGGGIEHMLTRNWTVKFEGLWVDGGSRVVNGNAFKAGVNNSSKFADQLVITRLGLNYKF